MATNVILPALGIAQDTGKIVEWLKAEGERVTQGEAIVTIETDKAAVDLEAPASGILARVSAKPGDEVPVAQVIAVILADDEAAQADTSPAPSASAAIAAPEAPTTPEGQPVMRATAGADGVAASAPARNGRRAASPKARRIATERGLDIAALRGSGPGGVVLAADVLAATATATAQATATRMVETLAPGPAPIAATAPPTETSSAAADLTLSTVWRLMAERTTQSWTSVPHFFLLREVNAAGLIAWRDRASRQVSDAVTYTDLLVKVVAEALRRHPRVNASWADGTIAAHDVINVGVAVATKDGLVVPVIQRADDLSLRGIARQRADLVARAQAGHLRLSDLQGGTFTISNLGMYGIDAFTAIINAPQAAILAVGRIADRVVPEDGKPAVQPMLTLSLSCDHRVVDGARGAEFIATVATLIEDPSELAG
jgi:pyruvate dehydrogenase E2 component (dihydrolipoamide acetyltransferase)